jgi:hypothetical protein
MRRPTLAALALATALAAPATPAAAAAPQPVAEPAVRTAGTTLRDCAARPAGGARGVHTQRLGFAREGVMTLRLGGPRGTDWDLGVFDAVDGRRVGGSAATGTREVVQVTARRGAQLLVQACRRAGTGTARLTAELADLDLDAFVRANTGRPSLVEVPLRDRDALSRLEETGVDVTHDVRPGRARVLAYEGDLARLARAGFDGVRTVVADVLALERRELVAQRRAARAAQASALPSGRTDYRNLEDYQRELKELVERNSGLVRALPSPGRTFQGREIPVVEIAKDVGRRDDGRPVFLLNAMHHAREWPGPEGVMEFALDLVRGFGRDERITKLLGDVRVVVMPLTNLDGFVVSRAYENLDLDPDEQMLYGTFYSTATGVALLGGSLSYKRKNCNPVGVTTAVPAGVCEAAIGVDNNRNYGESWGGPGASTNPNDQSFRGEGPFSEPETQAFRALFSRLNATVMISTHNVAALVLRPPGLEADGFAPDEPQLKVLGDAMARAAGYESQYGWQLYDTTGTTDDWTYSLTGAFSYTVEMGPAGGTFHGRYRRSVVEQYLGAGPTAGKGLREAYLQAAEAARNPAWTSRVAGRSIPGRTLRLTRQTTTQTFAVCPVTDLLPVNADDPTTCPVQGEEQSIPEKVVSEMRVPASGSFEWWVTPSTKPFVAKAGRRETYRLECLDGDRVLQATDVFVARGETAQLELPCGGTLRAAGPAPRTGIRLRVGKVLSPVAVINKRRRAIVPIRVSGGTLRNVRIALLARRGNRVLGEARLRELRSSRTARRVGVRLRRGVRVRVGAYRLRVTATQAKGSPIRITRATAVRRQQR